MTPQQFQRRILAWFDQHGRKTLPWQINKTPYRVWISEIMLQQTQVNTAIPYYERFLQRFPDLSTLAKASEDEVLHLWAGLGYYSRARNLHRAAKMIIEEYRGQFPDSLDALQTLPGIGQSTAGAIIAIAFQKRATILDGNVKRVLARFLAIEEPITEKNVENTLWHYATKFTPSTRIDDYTQAMMDVGATLCTRSKPACSKCPLIKDCGAYKKGIVHLLPLKKAAKELPVRKTTFLILKSSEAILLCKRPSQGIWGGLWSLPELNGEPEMKCIAQFCKSQFKLSIAESKPLVPFRHTFSHYHLDIFPILIEVKKRPRMAMEEDKQIWYNPHHPERIGLPKPVQSLMESLK